MGYVLNPFTGQFDYSAAGSGANTTLSNLSNPTSVNASLIPATTDTYNLGSNSSEWLNLYVKNVVASGMGSFGSTLSAANLSGTNSGDVTLGSPANGLSIVGQQLSLAQASATSIGALSAADWTTFNNKQAALGYTPENVANKGAANGYAPLDASAKVPYANLPSALMTFKGAWDPTTNTPTLANGTGNAGDTYRASVAGTSTAPIAATWFVGDFIIYSGTVWERSPAADGVISVNGMSGAVTLAQGNLTDSTSGADGITVTGGTNAVWGSGTSISQSAAGASTNGYLTSTDWNTFNSKQSTLTVGTINSQTLSSDGLVISGNQIFAQYANLSYPGMVSNTTQSFSGAKIFSTGLATPATLFLSGGATLQMQGTNGNSVTLTASSSTVTYNLVLPPAVASLPGQVLTSDTAGNLSWTTPAAAGITALTGDGSATGPGSAALTLATVNSNTGSFGSASSVGSFTVNGKGLITAASSTPIQIAESQVTNLTSDLASKVTANPGDIQPTSFSASASQTGQPVTGLSFSNSVVRGFNAMVTVVTASGLYENFELRGIQRSADWQMTAQSAGDSSGYTFSISASGQVNYSSPATTATIKFRAITLPA